MAKPAYVMLNATGTVLTAHTTDLGGVGTPGTAANSLEFLISQGYLQVREIPLSGGQVLIVLSKP